MSAKTNNFKIGLFVLAGVALLIVGVLAFGAKSYFEKKTMFETSVTGEVNGLSVGSRVELRGVPIGKVSQINFIWSVYPKSKSANIIVDFEVDQTILPTPPGKTLKEAAENAINHGLRAIVKGQGITGTSILALELLDPTNNPPPTIDYKPRHLYIPSAEGQFTRMLDSIEKSLKHIQHLDVSGIGAGITNSLQGVSRFMDKLNDLNLQSIGTNVNSLLTDLKGATRSLQETIDDVRKTINGMKLESVGTNTDGMITGLRETNLKLQTVLDHAAAMPLQDTVGDIRQAIETLNGVLLELKQYPSGFIFGQPPPPAKSVQTPRK